MASTRWIFWSAIALVGVAALGGGGTAAYFGYVNHKQAQFLKQGDEAYAAGDWPLARRNYASFLNRHPDDVAIFSKYADACMKITGNREKALQDASKTYIRLTQLQPNNVEFQEKLLNAKELQGSWSEVEYYAEFFLRTRENDPKLLNLRARALNRMGRRDEAIDAYRELVDKNIANAEAIGSLALLLNDRSLTSQADEVVQKAIERDGANPALFAYLMRYYVSVHNMPAAEDALAKAQSLAPADPEVLRATLQLAIQKRAWADAVAAGAKLIAVKTEEGDDYIMLSHAYSRLGQVNNAVETLSRLEPIFKADHPETQIALSDLLMSVKRFDEAKTLADDFRKTHPQNGLISDYFDARQCLADGNVDKAISILTTVVARNPSFSPAHIHLALAYIEQGRTNDARNALETYLNTFPDDENAQVLLERVKKPPRTTDDLLALTPQILENDASDAAAYTSVASSLYDLARRENRLPDAEATLFKLLNGAIQKDPKAPRPYTILLDMLVFEKKIQDAEALIGQAEKNGVSESTLRVLRAEYALGQGDLAKAQAEFDADLQNAQLKVEDIVTWARLFGLNEHIDTVEDIFTKASAKFSGEDRQKLGREHVLLLAYLGDTDGAVRTTTALAQAGIGPGYEAKVTVAQLLLQEGTPQAREQAGAMLASVRQQAPDDTQAKLLDAQLKIQSATPDYAEATDLYEGVLRADANNTTALVGLGGVALQQGDPKKALDCADRALQAAPGMLIAALLKADALTRLQRQTEAVELLRGVIVMAPQSVPALEMLINALLDLNRLDDAGHAYDKLKALPDTIRAKTLAMNRLEARMLMAQGDSTEAEAALRKRLEASPDDVDALQGLAAAMRRQGRANEGEALLSKHAERTADKANGWLLLAQYYIDGGAPEDLNKASTALTRALLAEPNSLAALRLSIDVQLLRTAFTEAIALCDRYLAQRPDDAPVLYRKAMAMTEMGDRSKEALQLIQRAIEQENRPEYLAVRGLLSARLEDYGQAIRDLQPLTKDLSKSAANIDLALAQSLAATGDMKLARQYLESARSKAKAGQAVDRRLLETVDRAIGQTGGQG